MVETQLYKTGKKGEIRTIIISYFEDKYTVSHGILDGKMQTQTTIPIPKNIGKMNETTVSQQSLLEYDSLIAKKIKAGYSTEQENLSTVMLVQKVKTYIGQERNVDWSRTVYISPKKNGVNGEFRLDKNDNLILLSRGGNEYPMLAHIESQMRELLKEIGTDSINGEIYKHSWHLQDITAAVKAFKPDSHEFPTSELEFHIFDLPNIGGDYEHRHKLTRDKQNIYGKIIDTEVSTVHNGSDIMRAHNYYTKIEYEGTIIRNARGLYKYNQRSSDVFKLKTAMDAEFLCIDFKIDKNNHPVLKCITKDKREFWVKPKGNNEQRQDILNNIEHWIKEWITVEFEMYSKDMIPQKCIGIGIRECTNNGEPLM